MAGTLDAIYDHDSGQIDALCAAYRGAGPLQRPFYTSPDVFKADMERQDLTERIKADMQRGNTLNVRGTPTVYLNGRELMPGKLVTEEDLRREIDATLGTSGK